MRDTFSTSTPPSNEQAESDEVALSTLIHALSNTNPQSDQEEMPQHESEGGNEAADSFDFWEHITMGALWLDVKYPRSHV